MRTGIIGTGRIGSTLARILVAAGHEVVLANARGPQSLGPLLAELGPAATGGRPPPAPPPAPNSRQFWASSSERGHL
ncbi:NAD(P)-binding domain-containing protein, partial [Streptomyces roseus]|uniref:NAD(P)-binding domain-containing protein n=1 Tax=Streptomyces roseus TaxID=66430 RepID=UPI00367BB940